MSYCISLSLKTACLKSFHKRKSIKNKSPENPMIQMAMIIINHYNYYSFKTLSVLSKYISYFAMSCIENYPQGVLECNVPAR